MTEWCIVAIPREDDPVWQYSSEKIPHTTLLFLGEPEEKTENLIQMSLYLQHVAESTLRPFYMEVDRRGTLGSDNADVLFFKKNSPDFQFIENVRTQLLSNAHISRAYNSVEQYPEWTPHLTMGYPSSPAKKKGDDSGRFWGIEFDRIALWNGDFTGPTLKLSYGDDALEESAMAMTDRNADAFLEHFGVKGMRWGRRKDIRPINTNEEVVMKVKPAQEPFPFTKGARYRQANADTAVTVTVQPNAKLKTQGGSNRGPHDDAVRAATARRIATSSTTDALSTKDLQDLVTRMNLEQQYSKLTAPQVTPGQKFVRDMVGEVGKNEGKKILAKQAVKLVGKAGKAFV